MLPERVISPTTSSASVRRPLAPSPDVATNTRITNRPRNPATSTPQIIPAEHAGPSARSEPASLDGHRPSAPLSEGADGRIGSRPHRRIAMAEKATATRFCQLRVRRVSPTSSLTPTSSVALPLAVYDWI